MSKILLFRFADPKNEPFNTLIDSDDICFTPDFKRILDIIPIFNIMLPLWIDSNLQFDTVFECLKNHVAIMKKVEDAENNGRKYFSSSVVNPNEELNIISLQPLKEMLVFYQKYHDVTQIELHDRDMAYLREYMVEYVRRNDYDEKHSRLNSVFFYENLEVAVMSNKHLHKQDGSFCEVEIKETRNLEKYDNRWLYDIGDTCIFNEFMNAAKNYWEGNMTEHPKIEYLFSGKYVLTEMRFSD